MALNALKAQRKGLRTSFSLMVKKIEEILNDTDDLRSLSVMKIQLMDKFQRLDVCQNKLSEMLLQSEGSEEAFNKDFEESESYRDKYIEICTLIDKMIQDSPIPAENEKRKFKLPEIELKKFNGEVKDFLAFWSQFKKIHEDESIADEDKMQYLIQSMEPNSKAERLIRSFPATAANYPKAINQLKERFGREDLLVQIYVRDLLTIVMKNAATGRVKTDLASLYDELESKLRALESLGRTQEKYGDFLMPLVESCLPEDVLLTWERSRNFMTENKNPRSLDQLMNFLRQEVQGEEMVTLARSGFGTSNFRKKDHQIEKTQKANEATASVLVSFENEGKKNCFFCDKSHPSERCFSAKKLSLFDKQKILFKKGICYTCLRKAGHLSRNCNIKNELNCSYCNNPHYEIMCPKLDKKCSQKTISKSENSLSNSSRSSIVYLQTLGVIIRSRHRQKVIRALLDTASQSSYVSKRMMNFLKSTPLRKEKMIHALFGGRETEPKKHDVFSVEISDLKETNSFNFEVLSEEKICGFVPKIRDYKILRELKRKKINLTDAYCKETEIDLLIGADLIGKLLTGNLVELDSGLTAIETKLGWTVIGKQNFGEKDNILTTLSMHVRNIPLNELWEIEVLGISDPIQENRQKENFDFTEFTDKMIILPNGRYEVELPWKWNVNALPSNKVLTWKRHIRMINKLKCGDFFDEYQRVFSEWEKLNIIEPVPDNELNNECHYMPHRPVIKLNSETTKIRPVFDASAAERGKPSLNDCLFKGPNLIELIPDIIDRFRMYPIGISADIEKAFLMLSVAPKDRDFLRFYYPCNEKQLSYRHCRVVFGVSSSPFLLNASVMHLLENSPSEYKEVANKLKRSFYVDNCVSGAFNIAEANKFIEQSKILMASRCFNLRSFESNVACKNVDKHSGNTSVLGIVWNLDNDTLSCCLNSEALTCERKITKRFILSTVQRIFDPIGLLTPATLLPKLWLQNMWKQKIDWDCELPSDITNKFLKWLKSICDLKDVLIPRYMSLNSSSELHVFVDASKEAYAACVFARSIVDSEVKVLLVRAKSRIAPLKSLSIPRLELMACCIGARLLTSVVKALSLPNLKVTFWTDSTTALWWIKEHGNWTVFVNNRVLEIRKLTNLESWRHIPGNMNTADLLSRGCSPQRMLISKWWEGPYWLKENPENWPLSEINSPPKEVDLERKKFKIMNVDLAKDAPIWLFDRISNYDKLLRVFAWVLRFINNCLKMPMKYENFEVSVCEIENSEKYLIRLIQRHYLHDKNFVNGIVTYKDYDGILRVKTKITERDDHESFLYPILLPDKCEFTKLIINSVHRNNCHAGIQILQSLLRERFWIIRSRRAIKNVLSKCIICKRFKTKSLLSEPTPLPPDRVSDCAIFEIAGIDLAGPLFLKSGGKVWITLFTCAVYRAVHLELVSSLSTDAFLLALRRFIARRGRPNTIYCDNGTNFKGAFNELSKLDWEKISKETMIHRIIWKFIPPAAPWWGGWWERLVRIVKELLKRTLGKSVLTYEELSTVLCECESIVNSRPLTYVSEDLRELIPITPNMFLIERRSSNISDILEVDSQNLAKRIKFRSKLVSDLKQRFRKEYLGALIQKRNEKHSREPRIGEIVLLGDDNKKRLFWPLAKVIELIPGRDGKVRTVKLKTQYGEILRPVQRIFPLEIPTIEICETESQNSSQSKKESDSRKDLKNKIIPDDMILKKYTSSGRCIKTPKRLDLFNNVCYMFETLSKSQRGEDVTK